MTPEVRKLLAYRYLGSVTSEDFVAWTISMLEADADSKNLRILASLSKPLYSLEVEEYLQRSFRDLGWPFPTREKILRLYGCDVAKGVLSEIIFPEAGCAEMYKICEALGNPPDLEIWRTLDTELLMIEMDEFKNGYGGEIDEQIIFEARKYKEMWCG